MSWLFQQLVGWQEICKDIVLILLALWAEDQIDQWRQRRRTAKWMAAGGKPIHLQKRKRSQE